VPADIFDVASVVIDVSKRTQQRTVHHAKDERRIFVGGTQLKISSCLPEGAANRSEIGRSSSRAAFAGRLEVSRDVKDGRGC
jgi:hypothetical protein